MAETFDHERLKVYQVVLEFIAVADSIIQGFPPGRAYVADQLQRAATSIGLNIAEGAGEFSRREKARFYRMAQRSTTECAALRDVCRTLKLTDEKLLSEGRTMLLRIVAMLVALGLRIGSGGGKKKPGSGLGSGSD